MGIFNVGTLYWVEIPRAQSRGVCIKDHSSVDCKNAPNLIGSHRTRTYQTRESNRRMCNPSSIITRSLRSGISFDSDRQVPRGTHIFSHRRYSTHPTCAPRRKPRSKVYRHQTSSSPPPAQSAPLQQPHFHPHHRLTLLRIPEQQSVRRFAEKKKRLEEQPKARPDP